MNKRSIFEEDNSSSCSPRERCQKSATGKTIASSLSGFCLSGAVAGPSVGFALKHMGYTSAMALSSGFAAALTAGCLGGVLCCCICTCCPCQCKKPGQSETSSLLPKVMSMKK